MRKVLIEFDCGVGVGDFSGFARSLLFVLEIIDAKWLPRDCHRRRKANRHSMVISASLEVYLMITRLKGGSFEGLSIYTT